LVSLQAWLLKYVIAEDGLVKSGLPAAALSTKFIVSFCEPAPVPLPNDFSASTVRAQLSE